MNAAALPHKLGSFLPAGLRSSLARLASRIGIEAVRDERGPTGREGFLRQVLPTEGRGAELGVHKGLFTEVLLRVVRPKELHIIDPWYLMGREWSWGSGDRSTVNALAQVIKRYESELVAGRVVLHVQDDLRAMAAFPDNYFDWVYIDTSHRYDDTLKELDAARRIVKATGVIAGDDWQSDSGHEHAGVKRAVEEFCSRTDYELIYASDRDAQWAIRCRAAD